MSSQIALFFRGVLIILRSIAVISSSVATIISSLLPLVLYSFIPTGHLILLFIFLIIATFIIHGVLTHSLNDYTDYLSGTDDYSPAILSGGSRVIHKGIISSDTLWLLGKWLAIVLIILAVLLAIFGQYKLTILLLIGIWAAASYSIPPIQLSYRPFLGEWLSLFPSILFIGFAGPWIILDSIPLWAIQNAVINALFCLTWVMVHHIPDVEADKQAVPMKRTSVVWFVDKFGMYYARFPALLYILIVGLCVFWLGFDRFWAAGCLIITTSIAATLIMKMNVEDHEQVSRYEKVLLLLAIVTAVQLGVFV